MRRNINKIVALAIGISVMSGSIIPVFAADIAQNSNNTTNVQTQAQVNGKVIAYGEVVVVDGNLAVNIIDVNKNNI